MSKYYKINQNIKHPEVRVLSATGDQLGVMSSQDAYFMAQNEGLDLIEITDKSTPPIVKIIDFQKFRYQEDKKNKAGSQTSGQEIKELRLKPFMAENDLKNMTNKARKLLESGDRIKFVVKFKGREITKKEFGDKVINQAIENVSDISTVVEAPKYMGKLLIAQIKPKK